MSLSQLANPILQSDCSHIVSRCRAIDSDAATKRYPHREAPGLGISSVFIKGSGRSRKTCAAVKVASASAALQTGSSIHELPQVARKTRSPPRIGVPGTSNLELLVLCNIATSPEPCLGSLTPLCDSSVLTIVRGLRFLLIFSFPMPCNVSELAGGLGWGWAGWAGWLGVSFLLCLRLPILAILAWVFGRALPASSSSTSLASPTTLAWISNFELRDI